MRDVGDHDGGGGFAGVPVEVDGGSVGTHEAVDTVQSGAENLCEKVGFGQNGLFFRGFFRGVNGDTESRNRKGLRLRDRD